MLAVHGVLDRTAAARLWPHAQRRAEAMRGCPLVIELAGVSSLDTAGAALVAAALHRHGDATLRGGPANAAALVAQAAATSHPPVPARVAPWTFSGVAASVATRSGEAVAFLGETLLAIGALPRMRRQFRLHDVALLADRAGNRAVPLMLLLGYLMGLILAFQSAIPLRRFGADLFVVNLVALSLLRELGPLLAAVILAGRTGSAFAAEIGTMKVNEELAALETMGLSSMTMLVLPRIAASILVMPVLTLMLELAGLCGMLSVMMAFGYSPAAVSGQLLRAVHGHDLWSGLFKAACFGVAVAGIGCRAGLGAGIGPRAVGQAATAAVVGGIVVTIALDGVFAVLFFRLGI